VWSSAWVWLAATLVALFIAVAVVPGLSVHGAQTYVWATLIIWATTAIADVFARRTISDERFEARLGRAERRKG